MVNLEAVAAGTGRNGACGAVAVQDPSSQPRWYHPAAAADLERDAVGCGGGDLDNTVAQDRLKRCGSDLGPGSNNHSGFPVGGCRVGGVHEHGQ